MKNILILMLLLLPTHISAGKDRLKEQAQKAQKLYTAEQLTKLKTQLDALHWNAKATAADLETKKLMSSPKPNYTSGASIETLLASANAHYEVWKLNKNKENLHKAVTYYNLLLSHNGSEKIDPDTHEAAGSVNLAHGKSLPLNKAYPFFKNAADYLTRAHSQLRETKKTIPAKLIEKLGLSHAHLGQYFTAHGNINNNDQDPKSEFTRSAGYLTSAAQLMGPAKTSSALLQNIGDVFFCLAGLLDAEFKKDTLEKSCEFYCQAISKLKPATPEYLKDDGEFAFFSEKPSCLFKGAASSISHLTEYINYPTEKIKKFLEEILAYYDIILADNKFNEYPYTTLSNMGCLYQFLYGYDAQTTTLNKAKKIYQCLVEERASEIDHLHLKVIALVYIKLGNASAQDKLLTNSKKEKEDLLIKANNLLEKAVDMLSKKLNAHEISYKDIANGQIWETYIENCIEVAPMLGPENGAPYLVKAIAQCRYALKQDPNNAKFNDQLLKLNSSIPSKKEKEQKPEIQKSEAEEFEELGDHHFEQYEANRTDMASLKKATTFFRRAVAAHGFKVPPSCTRKAAETHYILYVNDNKQPDTLRTCIANFDRYFIFNDYKECTNETLGTAGCAYFAYANTIEGEPALFYFKKAVLYFAHLGDQYTSYYDMPLAWLETSANAHYHLAQHGKLYGQINTRQQGYYNATASEMYECALARVPHDECHIVLIMNAATTYYFLWYNDTKSAVYVERSAELYDEVIDLLKARSPLSIMEKKDLHPQSVGVIRHGKNEISANLLINAAQAHMVVSGRALDRDQKLASARKACEYYTMAIVGHDLHKIEVKLLCECADANYTLHYLTDDDYFLNEARRFYDFLVERKARLTAPLLKQAGAVFYKTWFNNHDPEYLKKSSIAYENAVISYRLKLEKGKIKSKELYANKLFEDASNSFEQLAGLGIDVRNNLEKALTYMKEHHMHAGASKEVGKEVRRLMNAVNAYS